MTKRADGSVQERRWEGEGGCLVGFLSRMPHLRRQCAKWVRLKHADFKGAPIGSSQAVCAEPGL